MIFPQIVEVQPIQDAKQYQMSEEEVRAIMSNPLAEYAQSSGDFCQNLMGKDPARVVLVSGLPEGITGCIQRYTGLANERPTDKLFLELSDDKVLWLSKVVSTVVPEFSDEQDFAFRYLKFFMYDPDRLIKLGDSYFLKGPNVVEFDMSGTNVMIVTGVGSEEYGVETAEVSLFDLVESLNILGTLSNEEFNVLTNQVKLLLEGKYIAPPSISQSPETFFLSEPWMRIVQIETAALVIMELLLLYGMIRLVRDENKNTKQTESL